MPIEQSAAEQDHRDLRRKVSKQYRGKLQTEIEDMDLPNPVIRSHYRNGFIKQYVRDHLILRTEAASNTSTITASRKPSKIYLSSKKLYRRSTITTSTSSRISWKPLSIAVSCEAREPTITSTGKRIPGLKLDHPRQLALMHALVRFAHVAAGNTFTTAEIHPAVIEALGCAPESYTLASLRYDLSKLRAKGLVAKLRTLAAINSSRTGTRSASSSKALRTCLCPLTAGLLSPIKSDARLESPKAISTRSPLSERHRRS